MSRKANVLSCSGSTVNLMFSSIEFRWSVKCSTSLSCNTVNVSSIYLNQMSGGRGASLMALSSKCSMYRFATIGETSEPTDAPFCL